MPTLLVLVLLLLGAQRARIVRGQNGAFQIRGLVDESPGRMLERHQYEQEEAAVLQSASSLQTGREVRREEHHEQRVFEAGQGSCGFPDTRANADECMADLAKFPTLSARRGSASARKLACLAHNYLRPWMGIPGVTAGMGARGMINPAMLQQMGTMANVSTVPPYIPSRAQSPPRSSPYPRSSARGMINHAADEHDSKGAVTPWEQKESRAVFRGGMTNYKVIYPKHWRGSPRFRVHRMSDVRPDLLDARVVGGVDPEYRAGSSCKAIAIGDRLSLLFFTPLSPHLLLGPSNLQQYNLRQDAISFSKRLGPAELQSCKYQLDVDGGTGSRRVCGVLSSSQMLIKQASEHTQLFDPHSIPPLHPSLAPSLSLSLPSLHPLSPCRLRQDSISFGKRLGPTDMQGYKYELDVDGGTGSGRVCGVLSSSQMLIKQASEYTQFFDPLMCPYRHFLPTHRFFSDLFGRIEWARRNDGEARRIVRQANELARRCGWPKEPDKEAPPQMAAQM
ncbi:unnamed protein product [Closterium sp. Naga37s-1]|nr:unnamed protein product [Closterium sp. Naga37s-1]